MINLDLRRDTTDPAVYSAKAIPRTFASSLRVVCRIGPPGLDGKNTALSGERKVSRQVVARGGFPSRRGGEGRNKEEVPLYNVCT